MAKDDLTNEHERGFVKSFILPAQADRYSSQLSSPKHRRKILERLNHQVINDLVERCISSDSRPWPKDIAGCYLLADQNEYDGLTVSSIEAKAIVDAAYFGIIVSFVPGKLACYRGESPSSLIWLEHE